MRTLVRSIIGWLFRAGEDPSCETCQFFFGRRCHRYPPMWVSFQEYDHDDHESKPVLACKWPDSYDSEFEKGMFCGEYRRQ